MAPHLCTALIAVLYLHLVATVTAACDCGKNNLKNRIVGGNKSQVHEWPWLVVFHFKFPPYPLHCGGSLISTTWVLSAAHCFKGYRKEYFNVSIGEHNRYTGYDTPHTIHRSINHIEIHPNYHKQFFPINDIAVIQLSNPVHYSHVISPVCLPTRLHTQMFVGEDATVTGWGQTATSENSDVVLDVTLPIISNTQCEHNFRNIPHPFRIPDEQICAFEAGKSACKGDSGGPLVWLDDSGHYQQIGIVSWGGWYCSSPSVYTRVTSYIPWIEEYTNLKFCTP